MNNKLSFRPFRSTAAYSVGPLNFQSSLEVAEAWIVVWEMVRGNFEDDRSIRIA